MGTTTLGGRWLFLVSSLLLSTACGSDDDSSCDANGTCSGSGGQAGGGGRAGSGGSEPGSAGQSGNAGQSGGGCGDCAPEACCDGQCVDLATNPEHCGECGARCAGSNATLSCQAGACTIDSCTAGAFDCDQDPSNGCERTDVNTRAVPVLRSPMIGAYTGSVHAERSRKPKFMWQAPDTLGPCSGFTYQIQIDDSCERSSYASCPFASPEIDQAGITTLSWSPPSPLPVRTEVPVGTRYFWRVRACVGQSCSDWTPTRYLNVGRLMNDLNGDGYSDAIAVSRYKTGTVYYYQPQIMSGGPAANYTLGPAFSSAISEGQIGTLSFVGDINGDGFADALHTASYSQGLYMGAADLATIRARLLPRGASSMAGAALGDWNGDGYDDLVIGHFDQNSQAVGSVKVHHGGPEFDDVPDLNIAPGVRTTEEWFGVSVAGAVDMDGDGYSELAVLDTPDGVIDVIHGGAAPNPQARTLLRFGDTCHEGTIARAGDLNGDGLGELALSCGRSLSVFAGRSVLGVVPIWRTPPSVSSGDHFRIMLGGFDLGTDGIDDLVFYDGRLLVLPGTTELDARSPSYPLVPRLGDEDWLGGEGLSAGDCDGDGRADILTSGWGSSLYVYNGAEAAQNAATCEQPSASFPQIGNWCTMTGVELDINDGVIDRGELLAY